MASKDIEGSAINKALVMGNSKILDCIKDSVFRIYDECQLKSVKGVGDAMVKVSCCRAQGRWACWAC